MSAAARGVLACRHDALRVISDAFAAAARPSKGGFVRDALTASYPKLVSMLEAAFTRIQNESRIKVGTKHITCSVDSSKDKQHPLCSPASMQQPGAV